MTWASRRVLVTGGASFIGSHLVEALVSNGATVTVVDDLSSGRLENLGGLVSDGGVEFIEGTLLDQSLTDRVVRNQETIFHLAADHGGRGYIEMHQVQCGTNLALDGVLFHAAMQAEVEQIVFASSGCAYPVHLQSDVSEEIYLTEDMIGPPYNPDGMYGWAKLMGELQLAELARERGMKTASCRYFTVYGERGKEDHAIMAMIARAYIRQDPFEIWGDGSQIRNWTYVGDIVSGTLRVAEEITDGTAVNLGTMERTSVTEAAEMAISCARELAGDYDPEIRYLPDMPTGPLNRVADNSLAKELLGWEPSVGIDEGIRRTAGWYFGVKDRAEVSRTLEAALTER